jgi:hypothetical protein
MFCEGMFFALTPVTPQLGEQNNKIVVEVVCAFIALRAIRNIQKGNTLKLFNRAITGNALRL